MVQVGLTMCNAVTHSWRKQCSCATGRRPFAPRMLPTTTGQKSKANHPRRRNVAGADAAQYPGQGGVTARWKWDKAKAMLVFIGPALILPLSDPLMSLIDTVCLGRFAGTAQVAALGPTSLIFNFSSYVFNALGIATNTTVSNRLAKQDTKGACESATTALAFGLVSGVLMLVLLQAFGARLIAATGAVAAVQGPAAAYLRVRVFAQPALLVSIVTQSCLLAQRDSRSPALAVLLQVVINAALDTLLIVVFKAGVTGAAWATVVAQYAGMLLLLQRLHAKRRVWFGSLQKGLQRARVLWTTLAPLIVVYVSRNMCYALLQAAAAALPAVQLAAHQVVWSMYTISSFSTATLEQAALAFLPRADNSSQRSALITITRTLGLSMGAALGLTCFALARFVPSLFTPDTAVHLHMAQIAPLCGAVMLIVGAEVSAVAVLISMGWSQYLARSFIFTLAAVSAFLYGLRVYAGGIGLSGVWFGLIFFFTVRCLQSYLGVVLLRRKET